MLKNIPNILTLLRLLMVPVFIHVFVTYPENPTLSLGVYCAAMLTDAVDGNLARRWNCVSRFGALVDPVADKLMTIAAVACIVRADIIPLSALLLIAIKESVMMVCAAIAARAGIVIHAALPGKIATVLFTAAIILLMPWHGIAVMTAIGGYILNAAIIISYISAAYYASLVLKARRKQNAG